MTAPTGRQRTKESKRLHVVLRDGNLVEGAIHIAEDMSLVAFLGSRKGGFVNMVDAHRPKLQEPRGHLIVQTALAVLVTAPDANMAVVGPAGAGQGEREVELHLVGGKSLRGTMSLAPMQRMSDYLHHCGQFVGITKATLISEHKPIGDVAVNISAIALIREAKADTPAEPANG